MESQERINRQRVHHIVDSYQLAGDDVDEFSEYLLRLLEHYPQPLVELALAEGIIQGWSVFPMQKGLSFIQGVHGQLRIWRPELEVVPSVPSAMPRAVSKALGVALVGWQTTANPDDSGQPVRVEAKLTPAQFEYITGLDSSLVFDRDGRVWMDVAQGTQKPFEPRL